MRKWEDDVLVVVQVLSVAGFCSALVVLLLKAFS